MSTIKQHFKRINSEVKLLTGHVDQTDEFVATDDIRIGVEDLKTKIGLAKKIFRANGKLEE